MGRRSLVVVVGAIFTLAPGGLLALSAGGGATGAATTTLSVFHRPLIATGVRNDTVTSTNWSGYAVAAPSEFTEVVGTWVQPTATCTSKLTNTYAAFWVGIDGYTSSSVEQLGTDSDCSRGTPTYYAWYEMYPASSVTLSSTSYPVKAGDTLTGTVSRTALSYTLALTDSVGGVTKWKFSQAETGSDANSSAEWIAEAPEICTIFVCRGASLTNFGTVTFSLSRAADGGTLAPISSFTSASGPHEITMTNTLGTVRAQPSALATGGEGFTDTWHHS